MELREKGGKRKTVVVHHLLERYPDEYLSAAGIKAEAGMADRITLGEVKPIILTIGSFALHNGTHPDPQERPARPWELRRRWAGPRSD